MRAAHLWDFVQGLPQGVGSDVGADGWQRAQRWQALEQWQGKKTLILIAHRLSTVRAADAIHVLAQGRVLESGSHAELLARGGAYAAMVQAQVGD